MDPNLIQPAEIEKVLNEKFPDRKIMDEFGWTGEWNLGIKNILDIILDLQKIVKP